MYMQVFLGIFTCVAVIHVLYTCLPVDTMMPCIEVVFLQLTVSH